MEDSFGAGGTDFGGFGGFDMDLGDIFGSFSAEAPEQEVRQEAIYKGSDIQESFITFEEAAKGVENHQYQQI